MNNQATLEKMHQMKLYGLARAFKAAVETGMGKADLLIIDDFGLQQLEVQGRLALLEILEDRQGRKSTIVIFQFPLSKWHEVIGDPTYDCRCYL